MKKEFTEFHQQKEKQKLIDEIKGIEKKRKMFRKAKTIKPKSKPKPKTKTIKTFDEYSFSLIISVLSEIINKQRWQTSDINA